MITVNQLHSACGDAPNFAAVIANIGGIGGTRANVTGIKHEPHNLVLEIALPVAQETPPLDVPRPLARRYLSAHRTNPVNGCIEIAAMDEPGIGGAHHCYRVSVHPEGNHPSATTFIHFQNGAIAASGINGITNEALLAIVIDRLASFQEGPFACQSNADALSHAIASLGNLHRRTKARVAQGVEGTHALHVEQSPATVTTATSPAARKGKK